MFFVRITLAYRVMSGGGLLNCHGGGREEVELVDLFVVVVIWGY